MNKGQVLTEYILLVCLFFLIALGATRLFSGALTGYYRKVARIRTGVAGMGP